MKKDKKYGNLNNTLYEKNIDEIWNVLELFPKKYRKSFLKNLKTLIIKEVSKEEIQNIVNNESTEGVYIPDCNTIYYNKNPDNKTTINHELFHTTSINTKRTGIKGYLEIGQNIIRFGNNLNEGITEYLALKSINEKRSKNAYQLEVFVINCLTDIYGDKILTYYFKPSPEDFYKQFKNYHGIIIKIDLLLKKLKAYIYTTNTFEIYLLLMEVNPNILKEKNIYMEIPEIHKLNKHKIIINKLYDEEIKNNIMLAELNRENKPYQIILEKTQEIYDSWYKKEKDLLNEIIKRIIILGRINKLPDQLIKEMLINNLKHTEETQEVIKYHNKKLIRK